MFLPPDVCRFETQQGTTTAVVKLNTDGNRLEMFYISRRSYREPTFPNRRRKFQVDPDLLEVVVQDTERVYLQDPWNLRKP